MDEEVQKMIHGARVKAGLSQGRVLFFAGLRDDGRYAEYEKRLKSVTLNTADNFSRARLTRQVMREFGWKGWRHELAKRESKREAAQLLEVRRREELNATREELREESKQRRFEDVWSALPKNAPQSVELEWVSAHGAMLRASRDTKQKWYALTIDDILDAPSRAAVNALQHWVNHQAEFRKQLLGEQKKKGAEGEAEQVEQDVDLAEAEMLLKQFGGVACQG